MKRGCVNMRSQLRDLIFQMFDALAALLTLREVGVFEGVGRVCAGWGNHHKHLNRNTI
jgi:hypothetical protein